MKTTIFILIFILISCNSEQKYTTESTENPIFKIVPPLSTHTFSSTVFKIDNLKDTILITDKGSYISIPNNCFVNQKGEMVSNNIDIIFEEYLNPADIVLSGIPMVMLDNTDTIPFQSAGMCKITANVNSEVLQIDPAKRINIGLRNFAQDLDYNLYYFDTINGNWQEKKKNINPSLANDLPLVPINIKKADTNRIVNILIENYKIRPLYKIWHKSKFYIYGENTPPKVDSTVWWYDMSIKPTTNPDRFTLKFNGVDENRKQWSQLLTVQPMIDSVNFKSEMMNFRNNMRQYIKSIEKNIEQTKITIEKEKQDSIRNANEAIAQQLKIDNYNRINETRNEVLRSFSISRMGIYNCDRFYIRQVISMQKANFKINGTLTKFDASFVINKYDNVVLKNVPFYLNSYSIGLDYSQYIFIGILNNEIFFTPLKLNETNEGSYSVKKINLDEFKLMM